MHALPQDKFYVSISNNKYWTELFVIFNVAEGFNKNVSSSLGTWNVLALCRT